MVRSDYVGVGQVGGVAGADLKHRRILLVRAERTPLRNVESGSIPTAHGLPCRAPILIRVAAGLIGEPIRPAEASHERLRLVPDIDPIGYVKLFYSDLVRKHLDHG